MGFQTMNRDLLYEGSHEFSGIIKNMVLSMYNFR
jgi:hypothetical protein